MKRNLHLSFYPDSSTDFTRPVIVQSSRFSMVLIEPPKTRILRSEVVPPWLQPIELKLENSPGSGMQVSDLWTQRMRKRIVEGFFPNRVKSKIAPIFREYYINLSKKKQLRSLKKYDSSPNFTVNEPVTDRAGEEKEKLALSSYTGRAEPEPEGVRFPPIRVKKSSIKVAVDVMRPSKSLG